MALVLTTAGCVGPTTTSTTAPPAVSTVDSTLPDPEVPEPPTTVPATTTTLGPSSTTTSEPQGTAPTPTTLIDSICPDLSGGDPSWWVAGFDLGSGDALWVIPSLPVVAATRAGSTVAVTLDNEITALIDETTCAPLSTIPGTAPGPAIDGRLLVPDRSGLRAFDPMTGDLAWQIEWPGGSADVGGGAIAASGGVLVVADAAGRLILLDRETGATVVSASNELLASAPGTVHEGNGMWVLATADGTVAAYEESRLDERWSVQTGPTRPKVDATGSAVIVVSGTDVIALDPATGSETWRVGLPGALSQPVVDHDEVHVIDEFGRLHHLAFSDGSSAFADGLGTAPDATVLVTEPAIAVVTEDGLATGLTLLLQTSWIIDLPLEGSVAVAAIGPEVVVLAGPVNSG